MGRLGVRRAWVVLGRALAGLVLWTAPGLIWAAVPPPAASPLQAGEQLYRQGVLPSGQSLQGERIAGVGVSGPAAACITCHRASGLGSSEGRIVIPPIIGKYLFRPHSTNVRDTSLPHLPGYRSTREPYTDASLARAIREGVGPTGRRFSDLMPRYALDDDALASLVAYLKTLSSGPMPGVSDEVLHFATVVTPDADPRQRKAMLEVIERFFADKNAFIRGGVRPMQASREIEYRVSRRWQLHVWELSGPPAQWGTQLRERFAAEPVFAVISGLGRRTWAPVHEFCQAQHLPCLWPNIDLPVLADGDFYPLYFSGGVRLEAGLMLNQLDEARAAGEAIRLRQLFRADDIGAQAAQGLAAGATSSGALVQNVALPAAAPADALAAAVAAARPGETLVLWLRKADLAALPATPPAGVQVLVSGLMGGLEQAPLPPAWRAVARMSYPVDLPESRRVRMNFPLAWFKIRQIEIVDEKLQADTYVACGILAETLTDMLDSFVPDYLVERIEVMLSHRMVNGYYPRLSLAQGQRLASKGGYIVRFVGASGSSVVPEGEWTVP